MFFIIIIILHNATMVNIICRCYLYGTSRFVIPSEASVSPVLKEDMLALLNVITKFLISFHVFSSLRQRRLIEENHTYFDVPNCLSHRGVAEHVFFCSLSHRGAAEHVFFLKPEIRSALPRYDTE